LEINSASFDLWLMLEQGKWRHAKSGGWRPVFSMAPVAHHPTTSTNPV